MGSTLRWKGVSCGLMDIPGCQSAEIFLFGKDLVASRAWVNFTTIGLFLSTEYFPRCTQSRTASSPILLLIDLKIL